MDNTNMGHELAIDHSNNGPGPASQEIIELLAGAPNVLEFKPSPAAKQRVWDLVSREKNGNLSASERSELDHYAQVEHIMRLVKAQARKKRQTA